MSPCDFRQAEIPIFQPYSLLIFGWHDILRFTPYRLFRFRVRIHHYFRAPVGRHATGKSDRQQTDHCDFKPSIHLEITILFANRRIFQSGKA
ncbi:MAG: hypothetical protein DME46_02080 [Verrucomicrobia bacterium]|nr:MAG: hypothetical protein DME46_02080 [Verrucomicrobiota bacterium]